MRFTFSRMSVARVAWVHGINANQVFGWRRLYLAGRLGERKPAMKLLPVRVSESLPEPLPVERSSADLPKPQPGTIHIELRQARCASKAVPMRRWCACSGVPIVSDSRSSNETFKSAITGAPLTSFPVEGNDHRDMTEDTDKPKLKDSKGSDVHKAAREYLRILRLTIDDVKAARSVVVMNSLQLPCADCD